jgi:hypothetical protein
MKWKHFPLLAALLFLGSCNRTPGPVAAAPPPPPAIATSLAPLHSLSGKIYARVHVPKTDDPETPELARAAAATSAGDNFTGSKRKAAKLSIASGSAKSFTDLGDILDSLIPDSQMRAMNISSAPTSARLPQEQGVVTVTAFIYASSKETDNDFHCIVGRDPSQPERFMNVEVSGLPPSSSKFFATLKAARNEYKVFFSATPDGLPGSGYDKYTPPIPIKVTGSLFFDVDHGAGTVGPAGMTPTTAWEIHPVSNIQFEQP